MIEIQSPQSLVKTNHPLFWYCVSLVYPSTIITLGNRSVPNLGGSRSRWTLLFWIVHSRLELLGVHAIIISHGFHELGRDKFQTDASTDRHYPAMGLRALRIQPSIVGDTGSNFWWMPTANAHLSAPLSSGQAVLSLNVDNRHISKIFRIGNILLYNLIHY